MKPDIVQLLMIGNLGLRAGWGCLLKKHMVQPLLKHVLRHLLWEKKKLTCRKTEWILKQPNLCITSTYK